MNELTKTKLLVGAAFVLIPTALGLSIYFQYQRNIAIDELVQRSADNDLKYQEYMNTPSEHTLYCQDATPIHFTATPKQMDALFTLPPEMVNMVLDKQCNEHNKVAK